MSAQPQWKAPAGDRAPRTLTPLFSLVNFLTLLGKFNININDAFKDSGGIFETFESFRGRELKNLVHTSGLLRKDVSGIHFSEPSNPSPQRRGALSHKCHSRQISWYAERKLSRQSFLFNVLSYFQNIELSESLFFSLSWCLIGDLQKQYGKEFRFSLRRFFFTLNQHSGIWYLCDSTGDTHSPCTLFWQYVQYIICISQTTELLRFPPHDNHPWGWRRRLEKKKKKRWVTLQWRKMLCWCQGSEVKMHRLFVKPARQHGAYNQDLQGSISEHTTPAPLKQC